MYINDIMVFPAVYKPVYSPLTSSLTREMHLFISDSGVIISFFFKSRVGACVDHVNKYTCVCDGGYKGYDCEDEVDECLSSPCIRGENLNLRLLS